MMEKPGGRRHDAFTDYHQRIQMGDEVHGYEAEAVRTASVSASAASPLNMYFHYCSQSTDAESRTSQRLPETFEHNDKAMSKDTYRASNSSADRPFYG